MQKYCDYQLQKHNLQEITNKNKMHKQIVLKNARNTAEQKQRQEKKGSKP